jgi:hypothetical protein
MAACAASQPSGEWKVVGHDFEGDCSGGLFNGNDNLLCRLEYEVNRLPTLLTNRHSNRAYREDVSSYATKTPHMIQIATDGGYSENARTNNDIWQQERRNFYSDPLSFAPPV